MCIKYKEQEKRKKISSKIAEHEKGIFNTASAFNLCFASQLDLSTKLL